jgi:hypothetical protein
MISDEISSKKKIKYGSTIVSAPLSKSLVFLAIKN